MNSIAKKILLWSLFLTFFILTANVSAKSCKGMSQSSCSSSSSCSWVNGYKTKSGSQVSSYCRNKAKKSNKKESTKTPKKKTKYDTLELDKKEPKAKKDMSETSKKKDSKKKDVDNKKS